MVKRDNFLFLDYYELTMAAVYYARGMTDKATFSLFVRRYPTARNYFIAAGLKDALDQLQSFQFSADDIEYLKSFSTFSDDFISYLRGFKFTGDVRAVKEGSLFFVDEPVLEVTAPIIEAQLVETMLLNTIGFQTMIATKAARCVQAAGKIPVIDFGLRRTQGYDAGLGAARSSYIAGFSGTSNVAAGKVYGIPVTGTMAHSYVQSFENEEAAFEAYADLFPGRSVFLIDTYDTIKGAHIAAQVAIKKHRLGNEILGVRIDSGDMAADSRQVREILDGYGLNDLKIFASNGLDEFKIDQLICNDAKIDAFAVGTKIGVSADAPYMDIVYKLVRYNGHDVRKLSLGKSTLAGPKQVFRRFDSNGLYQKDIIGLLEDTVPDGKPLLQTVFKKGVPSKNNPSIDDIRGQCRQNLSKLPSKYKNLKNPGKYPVEISPRLSALQKSIRPD